jgi:hypothetical protein
MFKKNNKNGDHGSTSLGFFPSGEPTVHAGKGWFEKNPLVLRFERGDRHHKSDCMVLVKVPTELKNKNICSGENLFSYNIKPPSCATSPPLGDGAHFD